MILATHHYMNPAFEPYVFVAVVLLCVAWTVLAGYMVLSGCMHLLARSTPETAKKE